MNIRTDMSLDNTDVLAKPPINEDAGKDQNETLKRAEKVKELIEKYGAQAGGKLFFSEFKEDLQRMGGDAKALETAINPSLEMIANAEVFEHLSEIGIDKKIDGIMEIYVYMKSLMHDYDQQLMNVIGRHEEDFLTAYKTHMVKVEQQL